ncbi:unnamed protein product [Rhizoctonia solani]|uniref:Uncharacterized protein n=1 Tax=Rhizoctonia solani TaxID=456999 RepID=A0A8H2XVN2_9AGAM|nr:unnamed protein product [Rhizoctonia solani]
MILDADSPLKSPATSRPTIRQLPSSSLRHVTGAFSSSRDATIYSETTPLLYDRAPQSMYDDLQPPAYDDINGLSQKTSARQRLWARCAIAFLIVLLGVGIFSAYYLKKNRTIPTQPSRDPVKEPTPTKPLPSPSLPPLPQLPHFPDPSAPHVPPTSGRTDLCHPWAYTSFDNRPTDRLVYTVPSLLPMHIESGSICPTSSGQLESCSSSDEPISGKLQVLGADIELPHIEVSIRHGADDGLENVSVCLMQKGDRWILGLYVWGNEFTPLSQRLTPSASILVKLPYTQVHTLSTNLDYFTQSVGSNVLTETNALTFDALKFHAEGRGGVDVRNVTVGTMYAKIEVDNIQLEDTRVTKLLKLESYNGLIAGAVTLVYRDDSPPVEVDVKTTFATISFDATLEYSAQSKTAPRFDINLYSTYSPAILYTRDTLGTNSLATQTPPSILPLIHANVTSQYAMTQASVPATYHGSIELSSEYAAIATNDRAKGLANRSVSWKERVGMAYRGVVEWSHNGVPRRAGSVTVSTQFATARLMFLGLMDSETYRWQEEGTEIVYNLPVR